MTDRQLELAQRWLVRADNDLITARQTLLLLDSPTDTPCFHAQQAIEKALKALLTYRQIAFPRTHDLLRLLDLTLLLLPDLEEFRERFADMEAYAVDIRYPDFGFDPSRDEAFEALALAESIVIKVRNQVPVEP
jgi:HEPN domain-containing protein